MTSRESRTNRRDFIRLATAAAAFGPFFLFPDRALASQQTLKIAKWTHFVPEFDPWFESAAKEWGKQHDSKVIVDHIPVEQISARAAAEVKAGKGHDVFIFPWPPAEYQEHVIDHSEIYQTVAFKYGNVHRLGHRSTFNPKIRKYFAFCDSWMPAPLHYFADYWGEVGMALGPLHYNSLRSGGKRLRDKLGVPCGLALAPTLEGNITTHTLLYGFGGGVLGADGNLMIDTARTTEALKYVKLLYQDSGTPEQLTWGPAGNVRAMLARKSSCTINAISLLRVAEKQDPELAKKIMIQPPLIGFSGVFGLPHVTNCSVVWNFAQNQEAAKQIVADLVDNSKTAYEKSKGCNFPTHQKTVPDLVVRLQNDPQATPPWKYNALKDALHWTANIGYPGFSDPVTMEVFNSFIIQRMFLSVAKGERSPEDAGDTATAEVKRIADKWKHAGGENGPS